MALPPAMLAALQARQPPGAGTAPGQPPFGSSPLTAPVPHRGLEGEGMALVAEAKRMLEAAITKPGLGSDTKIGQAILKALLDIGRELPEGTISPGMRDAGMEQWMITRRQQAPQNNIIAALQQHAGAPPPAGAAAPPPHPMI